MVWLCTGIWHGANWTFIVWGLAYFVVLFIEKVFFPNTQVRDLKEGILKKIIKHGYTMLVVVLLWVIFRADSLNQAMMYIGNMFAIGSEHLWDSQTTELVANYGIGIVVAVLAATPLYKVVIKKIKIQEVIKDGIYCIWTILLFMISLCLIVNNSYNPFIYFNF
jgi:D-alanyl-lipoteichoic acid acyltransferase DltB (MBOAT superfamily)